jgi:hypothetical protein
MTLPLALHLLGSMVLLGLVRTTSAEDPLTAIGWAILLGGLALAIARVKGSTRGLTLGSMMVGILALGLMVAGGLGVLDGLSLEGEALGRAEVILAGLWPLLWFCATLTLLAVEWVRAANPVVLPRARARQAALAGLSAAFGIACLLPLNYLAHEHNERWDHSYFKTASPGSATQSLVENLTDPVQAYLFFPHTSDVTEEIRTYFDQLGAPGLEISYVDHALEGELAKELKVQKNGTIALVRGTGEEAQIQRIRIGTTLDKAQRKLKRLDQEIHKALLKIVGESRTAYVTVGHGEMYWKKGTGATSARLISTLKKDLRSLNFRVKELGPAQGLANEVPEDADLVMVLGPSSAFMAEEVAALRAYRARGGALLVALEPRTESGLAPLLEDLGLGFDGQQLLVGDRNILITTRRQTDRYNLITNKASTHPSVTTLSRNSRTMAFLAPVASPLSVLPDPGFKVEITLRTLPEVYLDLDNNLRFDGATEQKKGWSLAAAISGTVGEASESEDAPEFRAVVIGNAKWVSDLVLGMAQGNKSFVRDTVAWLVDEPAAGGLVHDEEDVKIKHTKEGQGWMFYGTSLLIPFGIFVLGMLWVVFRRRIRRTS